MREKEGPTTAQMVRALKLESNTLICLKCAQNSSDFLCLSCGHVADPACWPETNEGYDGPYCEICIDRIRIPGIRIKPPCPFGADK